MRKATIGIHCAMNLKVRSVSISTMTGSTAVRISILILMHADPMQCKEREDDGWMRDAHENICVYTQITNLLINCVTCQINLRISRTA